MRNSLSSRLNKNEQKDSINVLFSYDGRSDYAHPVRLTWKGETYFLGGVQFWYAELSKGVRVHHYRVSDENGEYSFELSLETDNLTWRLDKATPLSPSVDLNRRLIGVLS